jgi:hypothetical protein
MKYCILLLFLFLLWGCKSKNASDSATSKYTSKQLSHQPLLFPHSDSTFSWKIYEKQNDALKQQFITHHPTDLDDVFKAYKEFEPDMKWLNNAIHIMDVNGDGTDDVFYEGRSGGEADMAVIYLNTGSKFKKVFLTGQSVKKLEFKHGKLSLIYVRDPGCCASYMIFDKIYKVSYKGNIPAFKRIDLTGFYRRTKLPSEYLPNPIRFITVVDSCKLRTAPVVANTDTLGLAGELHPGNDVGSIGKGSAGRAIAKTKDHEGYQWFLVEMKANSVISGNVFYDDPDEGTSCKLGWINAKDIKLLVPNNK